MMANEIIIRSFPKAMTIGTNENPPVLKITIAAIAIKSCNNNIPSTNLP